MTPFTIERELLARAKRERAGLRVIWEQTEKLIPARRQARVAIELSKIKPVLIQKNGTRVPSEQPFRLTCTERQKLAARMLSEGAKRNEVLATVEISPAILRKLTRQALTPNGDRKPHSHAVKSDVSEVPAQVGRDGEKILGEEGNPVPVNNRFGDPVPSYLPPEQRGPCVVNGTEEPEMVAAILAGRVVPRGNEWVDLEEERAAPGNSDWRSWVYGAAKNPIHRKRRAR